VESFFSEMQCGSNDVLIHTGKVEQSKSSECLPAPAAASAVASSHQGEPTSPQQSIANQSQGAVTQSANQKPSVKLSSPVRLSGTVAPPHEVSLLFVVCLRGCQTNDKVGRFYLSILSVGRLPNRNLSYVVQKSFDFVGQDRTCSIFNDFVGRLFGKSANRFCLCCHGDCLPRKMNIYF